MTKLIAAIALLVLATGARAEPNRIQNGSFEFGSVANPCFIFDIPAGSNLITGWTVSRGTIDWDGPPPCSVQASKGGHSLDLVGQIGIGGIQQTFPTTRNICYKVAFDLAGNPGNPPVSKPLDVNIDGVLAGHFDFSIAGKSASNMGWVRKSVVFKATSSSTTVEFVSDVTSFGPPLNAGATLDNVVVRQTPCPVKP